MQHDTKVKGNDLFEELEPEKASNAKPLEARVNERVEALLKAYENSLKEPHDDDPYYHQFSKICARHLPSSYSQEELNQAAILLNKYAHLPQAPRTLGYFLSEAINRSLEKELVLNTKHFEHISNLGYNLLGKKLTIEGDVHQVAGCGMKSGELTINGHAGKVAGMDMSGGNLTVNGNVGSYLGCRMTGGKIHVHGSADKHVGKEMNRGEITVDGDSGPALGDDMKGGTIFVYGNASHYLSGWPRWGVGHFMTGGKIIVHGTIDSIADMKGGEIIALGRIQDITSTFGKNVWWPGKTEYYKESLRNLPRDAHSEKLLRNLQEQDEHYKKIVREVQEPHGKNERS